MRVKMVKARIYQPPKSAMQSGKTQKGWCLEFIRDSYNVDDIMGWLSSSDTRASELKLYFATVDEAKKYAESKGISFDVLAAASPKKIIKKSYVSNYKTAKRVEL